MSPQQEFELHSDETRLVARATETPSQSLKAELAPAVPTKVYNTYWKFAAERQRIFFRKLGGQPKPWTHDAILRRFKFTNAYRASDRVSQYLIRHVIYDGPQDPDNLFFRILLFKLFNRIATWRYLDTTIGPLTLENTTLAEINSSLTSRRESGKPLYSAAYIMPSATSFGYERKHRNHLELLKEMISDGLPKRICHARSMAEVFDSLQTYPSIGEFLAYQYCIDINYSQLTNFSEMEFVVPGPGAKSGIDKCFRTLGGLSKVEIIQLVTKRQHREFDRLDIRFPSLWGRPLQLIDCQNLFCEVDKYARLAHPNCEGGSDRTRIKQKYTATERSIDYMYPPEWNISVSKEWE